jgi:predicted TIM-barrel fold metal-dependent hydrolase
MTTDIHTHLGVSRNELTDVKPENVEKHVDMLISRMDTFGIDKAVLTPHEPIVKTSLYMKAAQIYPDRLFWACSVIPRPVDVARQRLKKQMDAGCKALVLDGVSYHPGDPAAGAIINEAVKNDLPVYLNNDLLLSETIAFIDKITEVHQEGKFVVLNMGGIFGFPQIIPLMSKDNVWLELSSTFIKIVESPLRVFLDSLVQDIGVRKLVFGSGYHGQYPDIMAALNMIDLNVETSRLIMKENAWLLLGLDFS